MVCLFHVSVDKANPKRDLLDVLGKGVKKKEKCFIWGYKKMKKGRKSKKKIFCTFPLCCLLIGERYVGRRKLLGDIDVCDKKSTMRRQDFNGKLCSFFISKF